MTRRTYYRNKNYDDISIIRCIEESMQRHLVNIKYQIVSAYNLILAKSYVMMAICMLYMVIKKAKESTHDPIPAFDNVGRLLSQLFFS